MRTAFRLLPVFAVGWTAAFAGAASGRPEPPASPAALAGRPEVRIWRLDCGQLQVNDASSFSDAGLYQGRSLHLSDGCYLIRHGRDLLLWDAGMPLALLGAPITADAVSPSLLVDLPSQLSRLGIRPSDVKWLAISHYHWDHVGQAETFPEATLLIGEADWAALRAHDPPFGSDPKLLDHWLNGGGKVEPVKGDQDVFGDGSVVILATPGHTPGSSALLVRLTSRSPVLLSGDVVLLEAQLARPVIPTWNTSRAESLASVARLRELARNLHAIVIVQHDPADISKLPAFPQSTP